jgi:hypothetical protein
LRTYGTSRVFPECEECGHPKVSHAEGRCFCGCAGPGRGTGPEIYHLEPTLTAAAAQYSGARDGWTHEEDDLLERRFLDGTPISQLSGIHSRRPSAIIQRLEQLGLVEPRRRAG